ncbi:MAG: hypothetical protein JRC69_06060 [Deltaproteobacteria bacterium]|nr:hypothetical protein [Deltaproteobacteria bacterium]
MKLYSVKLCGKNWKELPRIEMLADPELGKDFIKQIKSRGIREGEDANQLTDEVKQKIAAAGAAAAIETQKKPV